jgi:uncharacterized alkaline shock family protein YloU
MKFGVFLPSVAQKIQDNIKQTWLNMTALEAEKVNIYIVGIQFENQRAELEIEQVI